MAAGEGLGPSVLPSTTITLPVLAEACLAKPCLAEPSHALPCLPNERAARKP